MSLDAAHPYQLAAATLAEPYGAPLDPTHPYTLAAMVLAARYRWGDSGQVLGPDGTPLLDPGGASLFEPA